MGVESGTPPHPCLKGLTSRSSSLLGGTMGPYPIQSEWRIEIRLAHPLPISTEIVPTVKVLTLWEAPVFGDDFALCFFAFLQGDLRRFPAICTPQAWILQLGGPIFRGPSLQPQSQQTAVQGTEIHFAFKIATRLVRFLGFKCWFLEIGGQIEQVIN